MAFVHEVLTPEQREEVNSWKIKRPVFYCGRIVSEADIISPFEWTIDKERNMYLLHASVDLSNMKEFVFLFIWNHKNYLVQFTFSLEDDITSVWNVPKKYLIDNVFPYCTEEHFLDDLREALLVFGKAWRGSWNKEIRVRCNF